MAAERAVRAQTRRGLGASELDHAAFESGAEQLRQIGHAELFHHVEPMDLHCARADLQVFGDLDGGVSVPDQREDLLLTWSEVNDILLGRR